MPGTMDVGGIASRVSNALRRPQVTRARNSREVEYLTLRTWHRDSTIGLRRAVVLEFEAAVCGQWSGELNRPGALAHP